MQFLQFAVGTVSVLKLLHLGFFVLYATIAGVVFTIYYLTFLNLS